jgi:hypothetical protein
MKNQYIKKIIFSLTFLLLLCSNLFAQEFHKKFADWGFFTADFGNKKICYIISLPVKKDGNYNKRGEPYFLVINSADNIDEVMISSGYIYKEGSEVELSFGLKKINGFSYKNLAWAYNKSEDINIIKEMRRNLNFSVLGVNKNNRYSQDTYSLIGFNHAFQRMKESCQGDNFK